MYVAHRDMNFHLSDVGKPWLRPGDDVAGKYQKQEEGNDAKREDLGHVFLMVFCSVELSTYDEQGLKQEKWIREFYEGRGNFDISLEKYQ